MSVTALSARTGRHTSHPTGPGRTAAVTRRPSATPSTVAVPALTVTLAIPLAGETVSPEASRLLEAVRALVEQGQGAVTVATPVEQAGRGDSVPRQRSGEETAVAEPRSVDPTEVRLITASRQVLVGNQPMPMTRLEFDLLLFLADNPRRVFTRMQLLSAVWGYEHTGERTVDVHVRRLRVKLGVHVPVITTVYGVGYRLADDAKIVIVAPD